MESLSFSLSLDRKYKSIEISWRNEYSKSTEPKPIRGIHTMGGGKSFWSVCIVGLPVTNAYKLSPWHAEKGMQVGVAAIRARRFETRIRCSFLFFFFFSSNELGGSVWYNFDRKCCFSQFYETRKLRSLLREGWNISGGGGEGKKNRSGEIGKMEFPVRISPNGISPLDSTNGGNEGEKLAGIFDHDDPPEFHFSENVVRTFAPRAYWLTVANRFRCYGLLGRAIRFRGISSPAQPPFYVTIIASVNSAVPQLFAPSPLYYTRPNVPQSRAFQTAVNLTSSVGKRGRFPPPNFENLSKKISGDQRDIKRFVKTLMY